MHTKRRINEWLLTDTIPSPVVILRFSQEARFASKFEPLFGRNSCRPHLSAEAYLCVSMALKLFKLQTEDR
jgi:hypothetical protein